jgi:hypothetical protein
MEIVEIEPASLAEENKLKLSHMSEEEIRKAQQEIFERFGRLAYFFHKTLNF